MDIADEIQQILRSVLKAHRFNGRRGSESGIVPTVTNALNASGFSACKYRIPGPIVLGRAPEDGSLRVAQRFAEADIGVYRGDKLVAVIESEHDLAWVVPHGGRTPGSSAAPRYTMSSLAVSESGLPFTSYAPLERMAFIANWAGNAGTTQALLSKIQSSDVRVHNPEGLALFLISEMRDIRSDLLRPRLLSLGAQYFEAG